MLTHVAAPKCGSAPPRVRSTRPPCASEAWRPVESPQRCRSLGPPVCPLPRRHGERPMHGPARAPNIRCMYQKAHPLIRNTCLEASSCAATRGCAWPGSAVVRHTTLPAQWHACLPLPTRWRCYPACWQAGHRRVQRRVAETDGFLKPRLLTLGGAVMAGRDVICSGSDSKSSPLRGTLE